MSAPVVALGYHDKTTARLLRESGRAWNRCDLSTFVSAFEGVTSGSSSAARMIFWNHPTDVWTAWPVSFTNGHPTSERCCHETFRPNPFVDATQDKLRAVFRASARRQVFEEDACGNWRWAGDLRSVPERA
ncbi:hypothetical protein AB0L65_07880 [Nonomuraea sp. NPDC052116]|uniref:hypothetical protein n=1 Tax=Nonomuraea sp. NPDC052116 TaxID=3155665 RepID=UPI0034443E63